MPLGTQVVLCPGHIVLDGDLALPTTERDTAAPTPRAMSIMAKNSLISAAAELLLWIAARRRTNPHH